MSLFVVGKLDWMTFKDPSKSNNSMIPSHSFPVCWVLFVGWSVGRLTEMRKGNFVVINVTIIHVTLEECFLSKAVIILSLLTHLHIALLSCHWKRVWSVSLQRSSRSLLGLLCAVLLQLNSPCRCSSWTKKPNLMKSQGLKCNPAPLVLDFTLTHKPE